MLAVTETGAAAIRRQVDRLAQHVENALGDELRAGVEIMRISSSDDEFVAAEPSDGVAARGARRTDARATICRSSSPAAWPQESLICLKPSRSM